MEAQNQEATSKEPERPRDEPSGLEEPSASSGRRISGRTRNRPGRLASFSTGRAAYKKRKRGNSEDERDTNEAAAFPVIQPTEETSTDRGSPSRRSSRTPGQGRGRGRASRGKRARGNLRPSVSSSAVEAESTVEAPESSQAPEPVQPPSLGPAIKSVEQQDEMPDSGSYGKKGDKTSSSGGSGGGKKDSGSGGGRKSRESTVDTEATTEESTQRGRSRSGYN